MAVPVDLPLRSLLSLTLCSMLLGCQPKQPGVSQHASDAPVSARIGEEPSEEAVTPASDVVTPRTKPAKLATIESVPGIATPSSNNTLANETRRLDPAKDGWSTEAFSERASKQLKKLSAWLSAADKHLPSDIFTDQLVSTPLRPRKTSTAFEDSAFTVTRGIAPYPSDQSKTTLTNVASQLSQLLPASNDYHSHFKIVGVTVRGSTAETRLRCEFNATGEGMQVQQTAKWICSWVNVDSAVPKIGSIKLVDFEEVISKNSEKLFSDRTASVLATNACYSQQLNLPLDHWRDRTDWRFGWQVVGAHGIAVGDINGDGLEDVYFCETGGLPNRLLIQKADGTVRDISATAGVDIIEPTRAALILDLDNDGDQDLLLAVARFVLAFENDGKGHFTQHAALQSLSTIRSLAAADYDNDGLLDVYACGYSQRSTDSIGLGRPVPYHDANNGAPSYLLRNLGGLRFEDVTTRVGLDENNSRFSYAAAWEDYDNDGDLDLYVANDFGRNNLYRNDDGHFKDVAAAAGVEDLAAGMSVTWGDYNRDGLPDIYVSNMFSSAGNRIAKQANFQSGIDDDTRAMYQRHARGNSLFENRGNGTFRDVSEAAGITEARWAWGSNFVDINNDGWQDLVVANGMVTGTDDTGDL